MIRSFCGIFPSLQLSDTHKDVLRVTNQVMLQTAQHATHPRALLYYKNIL